MEDNIKTDNILVDTKVQDLGNGYAKIYQDVGFENSTSKIASKVTAIQDEHILSALEKIGYVYISHGFKAKIQNALTNLELSSFNQYEIKDILEYLVKNEEK